MSYRRKPLLFALSATAVLAGSAAFVAVASAAAAGCRVDYTVASRWDSGFTTSVQITNLGDPISGWRLAFPFTGGETVGQVWNATVTQSGSQVTAANAGYNAAIATNGQVSFGFQGAGTPQTPSSFTLNGTACTVA